MPTKRKRGRPPLPEGERKGGNLTIRFTPKVRHRLEVTAERNERSISEEIEFRIDRSFYLESMLSDALSLVVGAKPAGLLMLVINAMRSNGLIAKLANKRRGDRRSWIDSPESYAAVSDMLARVFQDAAPGGEVSDDALNLMLAEMLLARLQVEPVIEENESELYYSDAYRLLGQERYVLYEQNRAKSKAGAPTSDSLYAAMEADDPLDALIDLHHPDSEEGARFKAYAHARRADKPEGSVPTNENAAPAQPIAPLAQPSPNETDGDANHRFFAYLAEANDRLERERAASTAHPEVAYHHMLEQLGMEMERAFILFGGASQSSLAADSRSHQDAPPTDPAPPASLAGTGSGRKPRARRR